MKKALFILLASAFISQLNAYDKVSLVERFTNASCAPCASLNVWYNPLTHGWVNSGTISHLVYNVWWPGPNDPMYLLNVNDNTTRTNYYGCNYVPWFDVNGSHVNETQSALTSAVTNGNNQFAPFNIEMTQEALSENLIKIGFTITRDPTDVTTFGNIKLRVALTEKTVSYATPPGSNGETEFYSICRKMLPDAGGSTFTIPAPGESIDLSLEYVPTAAFLQAVNLDSLRIVAFIQDVATKMVYQSAMMEAVPNFVATINSLSSDIIDDTNSPSEFTTVLRNTGFMSDSYTIGASFDGPAGWSGNFTTVNGTFNFGETDIIQVGVGDSTVISVKLNPNGYNGSGMATVEFESQNNPGMVGSTTVRLVTIYGTDILVVDASGAGYGDYVTNSVGDVFSGTVGTVGSSALTPSTDLNNFQMIAWTAGVKLPVFKPDQVDALQTYLDNGGKLFIHGQDIGADVFGAGGQSQFAQAFYNNYLHASFVGNGTSYLINGIPGDPIGNGIQFVINDIYTRSPDNISPYDGNASSVFQYLNGPNIAGIKAAANDYKVVYFGIGFEQVPDVATRDTLASRIINYFGFQPMQLPSAPILVNPANAQTVDSSSVMFEWEQTQPQASKYWLELDTSSQFTNPVVESDITETTYLYTGLVANQTYYWRVRGWSENGWGNFSEVYSFNTLFTGIENENTQMPYSFNLGQNYPNPFNPSTTISYSVPKTTLVSIKIYDLTGQEVASLINEVKEAGTYQVKFSAEQIASGVYLYRMTADDFTSVKKLSVLK